LKSITYTEARENLANTINRVCEDNAPVIITRKRDQSVVMLSLSEYESLEETAHLLRSPANAKRLLDSLDSIKRGKLIRRKSISTSEISVYASGVGRLLVRAGG